MRHAVLTMAQYNCCESSGCKVTAGLPPQLCNPLCILDTLSPYQLVPELLSLLQEMWSFPCQLGEALYFPVVLEAGLQWHQALSDPRHSPRGWSAASRSKKMGIQEWILQWSVVVLFQKLGISQDEYFLEICISESLTAVEADLDPRSQCEFGDSSHWLCYLGPVDCYLERV